MGSGVKESYMCIANSLISIIVGLLLGTVICNAAEPVAAQNKSTPEISETNLKKMIFGDTLQLNGQKIHIKGAPALPQPEGYAKLSTDQKDEIKRFCMNMRYPAGSAYLKLQTTKLTKLKKDVDARIVILEAKTKEYQDWLDKRNQFLTNTKAALINIISKMKPDAAAAELEKIDDLAAASIIMKLKPGGASAIMNNFSPEKAAEITGIMISAQKLPAKKSQTIVKSSEHSDDVPRPLSNN